MTGPASERGGAGPESPSASSPSVQPIILERLGGGGMGEVHRGWDPALERHVAIKIMRPRRAQEARFLAEAKITAALEHPGIVPVYGLGQLEDGRPYYVMKQIKGRTFQALIDDPDHDEGELLEALSRACEAVASAHAAGLVHRDIKPENLMRGDFGETLVLDWGLVRVLDDEGGGAEPGATDSPRACEHGDTPSVSPSATLPSALLSPPSQTRSGEILGTPAYMAPEQARGEPAGPQADVFGLGAVLYQILSGRPPRDGKTVDMILIQAIRGEFDPLVQVRHDVSPQLAAVCEKAMALAPEDRYPDAWALSVELAAAIRARQAIDTSRALEGEARAAAGEIERALDDDSAEPIALSRQFGVARLGYEQALTHWPQNPRAREGLSQLKQLAECWGDVAARRGREGSNDDRALIERLLGEARTQTERMLARMRVIGSLLTLLMAIYFLGLDGEHFIRWTLLGQGALCLVVSAAQLRLLKSRPATTRIVLLGIGCELGTAMIAPILLVRAPELLPGGLIRHPATYLLLISVFLSGVRMSRKSMVIGVGLHMAAIIGLMIVDLGRNPASELIPWVSFVALAIFASLATIVTSRRTIGLLSKVTYHAREAQYSRSLFVDSGPEERPPEVSTVSPPAPSRG